MSLPPADQPFTYDDEEDRKRKAEIEDMMRSQRESYFRNGPVQQEYRDVVSRIANREEARSNAATTSTREPGPFDLALAQFLEKRAGAGADNEQPALPQPYRVVQADVSTGTRLDAENLDEADKAVPDAGAGMSDRLPVSRLQSSERPDTSPWQPENLDQEF